MNIDDFSVASHETSASEVISMSPEEKEMTRWFSDP